MPNPSQFRMPLIGSLVLAVVATTLLAPTAEGIGLVCTGSKDHLIITLAAPTTALLAETVGSITMDVGDATKGRDGLTRRSIEVLEVTSEGRIAKMGTAVRLQADPKREAEASRIVSLQRGREFPALQTVSFHFTVDIEGVGVFRSINPVEITGTITSLPPRPGTTYELLNRIKLEDPAWPGEVAAVIEPGQVFTVENAE